MTLKIKSEKIEMNETYLDELKSEKFDFYE